MPYFTESEVRARGRKMYEQYSQLITLFLEINPKPSDAQFHALAEACGVDKETLEAVAYQMLAEHEGSDVPVDADNDRFSGESLGADVVDLIDDDPVALAEPPAEQEEVEDENADSFNEQAIGDDEEGDDVEVDADTCNVGLLAALTPGVDDADLSVDERTMSGDVGQDYMNYKDAALNDGSKDPKDSTEIQDDTESDGASTRFDKGPLESDGPVVPSITKSAPPDEKILARVLARLASTKP